MAEYSIRVADAYGNHLFETRQFLEAGNQPGLRYVLSAGKIGALTVTLPPDFDSLLLKDGRIGVWRSVAGQSPQLDGGSVFLIRRWDYGDDYTTVTALHANHLLFRRIVAYGPADYSANGYYGQAYSGYTADGSIIRVCLENLGTSIDSSLRFGTDTRADVSAYLTIPASSPALAQNVSYSMCCQNLYDAIQAICDASTAYGTYLCAEIVAPTENTLALRTFTTARGGDRRASSGNSLVFSRNRGNIENALLVVDATNEITFAAASPNQGFTFGTYLNLPGDSPFDRIETFVNSGFNVVTDDTGALSGAARAAVRAGRVTQTLTADLVETDQCQRGVHFDFGDLVTIEHRGVQYDARLDTLDITVGANGERTIMHFKQNL